ncbi:multiubiquitin domain-containing protein [Sphingomonas crusticola]|uniref:multiubiquitin domain-containing protein n=1 Tax=Sphingomonas crusticola TaxID=1697973 RepID=UPI000E282647|nr:multiubiquitin domain-containing protein [Sphingomonas crusticola]
MEQTLTSPNAAHANVVDVAGTDLVFRPVPVTDRTPTARQVLAAMNLAPHDEYVVLQWLPGRDIEEVRPEELVDMSDATTSKLIIAKSDRTYRLMLNDHALEWPEAEITEEALRILGAIDASLQIFLTRDDEADRLLEPGDKVNLRAEGVETLYAKSKEWKLNVQGVVIESDAPEIVVRDAIAKAGFDVETKWIIILKTATERKQVDLNYVIDLREPGIEKLRLTPREINNGEVSAGFRRDFALLPADHARLDEHGYDWIAMIENGRRWLILRNVHLPAGYNLSVATIAMEVPSAYPMAEIDMFYCSPHLARLDGHMIPQTQVNESIGGRTFQRWSRHRGALAPWVPGKDSVVTHLLLIEESLNREVDK